MTNRENILLEKVGKELPFGVPENYFNQFALQIEDQIGHKHVVGRNVFKSWMFMAAMFVGVVVMGQLFYASHQRTLARNADNYETYVLSQVDETSLVDYYVDESNK
jgi:hypothetical protein